MKAEEIQTHEDVEEYPHYWSSETHGETWKLRKFKHTKMWKNTLTAEWIQTNEDAEEYHHYRIKLIWNLRWVVKVEEIQTNEEAEEITE